jgi:hypothetical protein
MSNPASPSHSDKSVERLDSHVDRSDVARTAQSQELEQAQAHKPEPDDRHAIAELRAGAPLGFDQTTQRLTECQFERDALRQRHNVEFVGHDILGEGRLEATGDSVVRPDACDARADRADDS